MLDDDSCNSVSFLTKNDVGFDLTSHCMPKNDVGRLFMTISKNILPNSDVGSDLTSQVFTK
jgi:hypothetical protein